MPRVRIPAPLRASTGGLAVVEVEGHRVDELLTALAVAHPGVAARVLDADGQLHRFVNVFVAERDVRDEQGLATPVGAGEIVTIVPAVAGGAGARGPGPGPPGIASSSRQQRAGVCGREPVGRGSRP